MKLHVHTLLHLVSISFAVGLAYIALDRFRYTNVVKELLFNALQRINHPSTPYNPAQLETFKLKINDKLNECEDGLGMKLFYKWGCKTFGGSQTGWDMPVMRLFLFLNFISLCIGSFIIDELYQPIYWIMFIVAIFGIVCPVGFIYRGMKHINEVKKFLDYEFKFISRLPLKESVEELQDSTKKMSQ